MRIYIMSNAPFVGSGYGRQAELMALRMIESGYQVQVRGNFGHHGPPLTYEGIRVLPASLDGHGADIVEADIANLKPDLPIILYDSWVFSPEILSQVVLMAPVDHHPLPPAVEIAVKSAKHVWAYSRHGEAEMKRVGVTPDYVPHCVDTEVFKPVDRSRARELWGVDEDIFFAVMVGANKGWPMRKNFDRALKAWSMFLKTLKIGQKAMLYIHTLPTEQFNGLNLRRVAEYYDVPVDTLRFPNEYQWINHNYTLPMLNNMFNAADVLLHPAAGGGFEVPLIEAQAAGCPVIATEWTAMSELIGPGYGLKIDPVEDTFFTAQYSEQAFPKIREIRDGLEWALSRRGDQPLRDKSREFAMGYDHKTVWDRYMNPAIMRYKQGQDDLVEAREKRRKAREALRNIKTTDGALNAVKKGTGTLSGAKSPVVYGIFARPALVQRVMMRIAEYQPDKLLVFGDAGRNPHEHEKVMESRQIVAEIAKTWDCELLTHYADANMGPNARMMSGVSWAFEQVDRAIVLEEDILPDASFFPYAAELLERYKDDERVTMIGGYNYAGRETHHECSYRFSRYAGGWGWATWADRWMDDPTQNRLSPLSEKIDVMFTHNVAEADALKKILRGVDNFSWDYKWFLARLDGLTTMPRVNLVKNLGDHDGATVSGPNRWTELDAQSIELPLVHPDAVAMSDADRAADTHIAEIGAFGPSFPVRKASYDTA